MSPLEIRKKLRIFAIIASCFVLGALLCVVLLRDGSHLIFQMDVWIYYAAFVSVVVYGMFWLYYAIRKLHWALRTLIFLAPIFCLLFFIFIFACVGVFSRDTRIWSNDQYVVYHAGNPWIDPSFFVLYERKGIIEKQCFALGREFFDPDKIEYYFDKKRDFIREEADWTFDGDSWHTTKFYRLSDGELYTHQNPMDSSLWSGEYYAYDKQSSLTQQLEVEVVHDTLIFNYYIDLRKVKSEGKENEKEYTLKGRAFLKKGDAETDVDEQGNAFLVDEYVYNEGGDYLAFRVQAEKHDVIRVVADDSTAARYHIPTSTTFDPKW